MSDLQNYRGTRAVGRRLGVSAPTALRLLRERAIRHTRVGHVYRTTEADVRAFEERRTFPAVA